MRRIVTLALVPLLAAGDCRPVPPVPPVPPAPSSSGTPSNNPGFPMPTAVTKANIKESGVWTEIGDADWTCLGTPSSDLASTRSIALAGNVEDIQTGTPVGTASVRAFPGIMLDDNVGQALTSNVAATRGDYTMNLAMLPAGETRFGFKIQATGYLATYVLNQYFDSATPTRTLMAISESTANALPAFIGVTRDPVRGVVGGVFRDCAGREVSNAVATVSSTAGTVNHLPGGDTYYFSAASLSLPVRHNRSATMNKDGLFVVLGLTAQTSPAFVQIWGFTTEAELRSGVLTMLAESPSPVIANTVIVGLFEPKRSN